MISDSDPEASLRNDVVSLAEETGLYSKDIDPTRSLERLAEIAEKHLSSGDPSTGQHSINFLQSLGQVPNLLEETYLQIYLHQVIA